MPSHMSVVTYIHVYVYTHIRIVPTEVELLVIYTDTNILLEICKGDTWEATFSHERVRFHRPGNFPHAPS